MMLITVTQPVAQPHITINMRQNRRWSLHKMHVIIGIAPDMKKVTCRMWRKCHMIFNNVCRNTTLAEFWL